MNGDLSRSTYRPSNHYSSVRLQQGRVLLDAEWNEQRRHRHARGPDDGRRRRRAQWRAQTSPDQPAHFEVTVAQNGRDLRIAPGRIYVDGILCENDEASGTLYTRQTDLPGAALPTASGPHAVYLDVWERHLTPVDQHGDDFPLLRESALSGPDTATRTRVVWQVKLAPVRTKSCDAFTKPPAPDRPAAGAGDQGRATPVSDCLVPAGGGYRRLENQLYRVEIHDVGQAADVVQVVARQRQRRLEGEGDRRQRPHHRGRGPGSRRGARLRRREVGRARATRSACSGACRASWSRCGR